MRAKAFNIFVTILCWFPMKKFIMNFFVKVCIALSTILTYYLFRSHIFIKLIDLINFIKPYPISFNVTDFFRIQRSNKNTKTYSHILFMNVFRLNIIGMDKYSLNFILVNISHIIKSLS